MIRSKRRATVVLTLPTVIGMALAGCAGAGGGASSGEEGSDSLNVLMVGNPQMVDIEKLTEDTFTADTGIDVNYTILPTRSWRRCPVPTGSCTGFPSTASRPS